MEDYERLLDQLVKRVIADDEAKRKAGRLPVRRSEEQAIEYRNVIDNTYQSIVDSFVTPSKVFPQPLEHISTMFMKTDLLNFHTVLNDFLISPHAIAKAVNKLSMSRGRYDDIGKFCNLFALNGVLPTLSKGPEAIAARYLRPIQGLQKGFEELSIGGWAFSEVGIVACSYLYWLLYDYADGSLNLDLFPALATATKGDIEKCKTGVIGYWLARQANPVTSMQFFYSDVLPKAPSWL